MMEKRPGTSIGAKLARSLTEKFGGVRTEVLEALQPSGSRHAVYLLEDGRVVDVFLKSARLYDSEDELRADVETARA